MKNVSTKGGSGLPKASILAAPAMKGAMKMAKPVAKAKKSAKSLMTKRAK